MSPSHGVACRYPPISMVTTGCVDVTSNFIHVRSSLMIVSLSLLCSCGMYTDTVINEKPSCDVHVPNRDKVSK